MGRASHCKIASFVALAAALGTAGAASARPGADIQLAASGITAAEARAAGPVNPDGARATEAPAARVTISRAADLIGKPVYFSRSGGVGSAGQVSFSARALPAGAVFSVALRPLRSPFSPPSLAGLTGVMPSLMPVAARALTSGFGMREHPLLGTWRVHSGVDLAANFGSPIVATSDGIVGTAGWAGGYGLLVGLDHGNGLETRYGHMSRLNVSAGQPVRKGDVIGYVGSTGMSTGPHLHYEIRVNGQAVNPAAHLHGR